jgi:CRISPR-associated protein Csm4
MQLTIIRLQPHGAFHFGRHGIGMEASADHCPSDSLYAALLWEQIQSGGTDWPRSGQTDAPVPPFRLSSCLPYVGSVPLLPLPLLPPPPATEQHAGERKLFKKIRFVSPSIFRALLEGRSLRDFLPDRNGKISRALQGGSVLLSSEDESGGSHDVPELADNAPIWSNENIPHVAVGRVNNASQYYETGDVRFAAGCGLAVLVQGDVSILMPLLQLLGESGLGGRRSKGLGQFTPVVSGTLDLPDPSSQRLVLLSRYLPSSDELAAGVLGQVASYQLVDVGGWLYTPSSIAQRRRSVRLLSEGSVVQRSSNGAPAGLICDVAPNYAPFPHPVWRYGLALTVGVPGEAIWQPTD